MAEFTTHTLETAPEASKPLIEAVTAKFGFVPNLVGVLAESPAALKAYLMVAGSVEEGSLTPTEQQVVLMATSFENACIYCMAAHSFVATSSGVPADVIESLRSGTAIADPKLNAMVTLTREAVRNGGLVDAATTDAFMAAGYTNENLLDVITAIGQKMLSNYTNHFSNNQPDEPFAAHAWTKPELADH